MNKSFYHGVRTGLLPFFVKVSGTIIAFVLSIFLARELGVENYGTYSLVISIILILSIPIQSGIPTLATREVSQAITKSNNSTILSFMKWTNRIIVIYSTGIVIISIFTFIALRENQFVQFCLIAIVSVGITSMTLRNSAVLRGLGRFEEGMLPDTLIRPLAQLVIFATISFSVAPQNSSVQTALVAFTTAAVFAFFASFFWLKTQLRIQEDHPKKDLVVPLKWRKAIIFLTVAGGGQVLFGNIDTLMLGALGDRADVGSYKVALQISMLLIFILTIMNQVLQPKIAKLFALKDLAELQRITAESSFSMFIATLIPAILLLAYATPMLNFIFGEEYIAASAALQILAVGQLINVLFGSVGTILNMTGMEKESVTAITIAVVANIILDILLIPKLGINGAALASAISIFIWNVISRHYVIRKVGIESSGVIYKIRQYF